MPETEKEKGKEKDPAHILKLFDHFSLPVFRIDATNLTLACCGFAVINIQLQKNIWYAALLNNSCHHKD